MNAEWAIDRGHGEARCGRGFRRHGELNVSFFYSRWENLVARLDD